jgi:hypothetical protein
MRLTPGSARTRRSPFLRLEAVPTSATTSKSCHPWAWAKGLQALHLALQVRLLVGGGDAGVKHGAPFGDGFLHPGWCPKGS